MNFKAIFSADNNLWFFDQNDFKDAVTLLVFNDKRETNEDDLELKKLISLQFDNDSELKLWTTDLFDEVCLFNILSFSTMTMISGVRKITKAFIKTTNLYFNLS